MSELSISVCARCGHPAYPRRELCPRCHSPRWTLEPAGPGTLEETTVVERAVGVGSAGVKLASIRLDRGPVVIAGLEAPPEAGMRVSLEATATGVRARPAADPETNQEEMRCLS